MQATCAMRFRAAVAPSRRGDRREAKRVSRASSKMTDKLTMVTRREHDAARTVLSVSSIAAAIIATASFTVVAPDAKAIDLVRVDPAVTEYMQKRDEAASFKCKGGMFDCDSDRREYARAQSEKLVARLATQEPGDEPACSVEDPCTNDVLRAAFMGTSGLTTSEKLEKMGRSADVANSTSQYFDK